jgi:hypothetical protein
VEREKRVDEYRTEDILLSNLNLDLQNPCNDNVDSQIEALAVMIEEQGVKLATLAEDIARNGLNPSESMMVMQDETEPEMYTVLEGNRRITALKVLNDPDLIPSTVKPAILRRFRKASEEFHRAPISSVKCVIFKNRNAADVWIELRHTGQNQGVGIVPWDADQVKRFQERRGESSRTLQVINFINESSYLDLETKANIGSISVSNLDRLLDDPDVRAKLGISINEGKIVTDFPVREVAKGLSKIIRDLVCKEINVNDIRHKADRTNYIESFGPEDLPQPGMKLDSYRILESESVQYNPETDETTTGTPNPEECFHCHVNDHSAGFL